MSPSLIDLRVGHILKAERHPNADSLYVSTIAVGDEAGTENTSEYEGKVVRTVCSGLNGLVPLEEMQGRKAKAENEQVHRSHPYRIAPFGAHMIVGFSGEAIVGARPQPAGKYVLS